MFNNSKMHKGKYIPKNKGKYIGDITKIRTLSSWEYGFCMFCDNNPDILFWSSEATKVPYKCGTDGKVHEYIIDFTIKYKNGRILLIEIKPEKQTIQPSLSRGKSKKTILTEQLAFIKNKSKWLAANQYALTVGAEFKIYTERKLRQLGIPII